MYCPKCGANNSDESTFCSSCGATLMQTQNDYQIPNPNVKPQKNKTLATVLSVLLVGSGQMYLGQVAKGIVMLIGGIVIGAITGGVAAVPIWILSGIDAYKIADKINSGKKVGEWEFF